jgi:D-alanyl-D-alanine carboxypeptidase/D-alanyl-D-alanine-endopeptidase (penicillin-binding protein 4)
MRCLRQSLALVAGTLIAAGGAMTAAGSTLPADVRAALERAGVPESAVAVAVHDAASGRPLYGVNAEQPMNPASLQKLLTTTAALERLGPAFTWSTGVWLAGPVKDGALEGALHLRGSGDPKLVIERLWLLLRRVQQLGVREIRGDIVLDGSAFAVPDTPPGDFDGEALRPYNARPGALLLNYRAVLYTFVPDVAAGVARVAVEPPLARSPVDRTVPLATGPCGDWRGALQAGFGVEGQGGNGANAGTRTRFAGSYATACGESTWPIADAHPASYDARLLEGLWREMGGTLAGRVREGRAPDTPPSFELRSPPLAEVVRDINKFSNNVMAEQLLLTLAAQARPGVPATPEAAREVLRRWLGERLGEPGPEVVVHNGSGLSRENRLSARLLARLLVAVFASPVMPELAASLPVSGTDGTLRRMRSGIGRAHLKTGSLRDVAGLAGYVLPQQGAAAGRRLVLVALINHPNANAARPALEALVQGAIAGTLPLADRTERLERIERPARPGSPP